MTHSHGLFNLPDIQGDLGARFQSTICSLWGKKAQSLLIELKLVIECKKFSKNKEQKKHRKFKTEILNVISPISRSIKQSLIKYKH